MGTNQDSGVTTMFYGTAVAVLISVIGWMIITINSFPNEYMKAVDAHMFHEQISSDISGLRNKEIVNREDDLASFRKLQNEISQEEIRNMQMIETLSLKCSDRINDLSTRVSSVEQSIISHENPSK